MAKPERENRAPITGFVLLSGSYFSVSQTLVAPAPSMRVLFDERLAPLTLKTSERYWFDLIERAFSGGVTPGSARNKFW